MWKCMRNWKRKISVLERVQRDGVVRRNCV